MRRFHRPVHRASDVLEELSGSGDPADLSLAAHDTAALLVLLGKDPSPEIHARLTEYLEREGIDDLLALWQQAAPVSLPGALWRLHQVEKLLPEGPVAEEVRQLMAGHFEGEFADLCDRAAIIGRRLGPRWDQRASELEACAREWRAGSLW